MTDIEARHAKARFGYDCSNANGWTTDECRMSRLAPLPVVDGESPGLFVVMTCRVCGEEHRIVFPAG